MHGYNGKILHIDLTSRKSWSESKPEEWYKTYIGGVSMATRLCWENIEVGCDPLSPGNPICIGGGIFAGTPVPVGGKHGLASKSPLTGFIGDSLSGSWFSIALKRAGWDGIVVHGASDDWVYVSVNDCWEWERSRPKRQSARSLATTRCGQRPSARQGKTRYCSPT